jgi:AI-2 transport protein TqsA
MENSFNKINNNCLVVLAATAIVAGLIYTKTILIPFVIAVFLYAVITPLIQYLTTKFRIPKIISTALAILFVILIALILIAVITTSLQDFFHGAEVYKDKMARFVEHGTIKLAEHGIQTDASSIRNELKELPVFSMAQKFTGGILSFFSNLVLVLIILLFLLAGEGKAEKHTSFFSEVQTKISRYMSTKLFTSISTAVLVGLVLMFLKVELALMFAVLTFFLNFIPSFGSIIATLLPLPVLALQFGFGFQFYLAIILTGAIQFLIGNVLEPKFMGESMDLHPVTIIIFLLFWGLIWGLPGMFLAVPITAVLKIILERIETTRPIAEILAGRMS